MDFKNKPIKPGEVVSSQWTHQYTRVALLLEYVRCVFHSPIVESAFDYVMYFNDSPLFFFNYVWFRQSIPFYFCVPAHPYSVTVLVFCIALQNLVEYAV